MKEKEHHKMLISARLFLTLSIALTIANFGLYIDYIIKFESYMYLDIYPQLVFEKGIYGICLSILSFILFILLLIIDYTSIPKDDKLVNNSSYSVYSGKQIYLNIILTFLFSILIYSCFLGLGIVSGILQIELILLLPVVPMLTFFLTRLTKDVFACSFHGEIIIHRHSTCMMLFEVIITIIVNLFTWFALQMNASKSIYNTSTIIVTVCMTLYVSFSFISAFVSTFSRINWVETYLLQQDFNVRLGQSRLEAINKDKKDEEKYLDLRKRYLEIKFKKQLLLDCILLCILCSLQLSIYFGFLNIT